MRFAPENTSCYYMYSEVPSSLNIFNYTIVCDPSLPFMLRLALIVDLVLTILSNNNIYHRIGLSLFRLNMNAIV